MLYKLRLLFLSEGKAQVWYESQLMLVVSVKKMVQCCIAVTLAIYLAKQKQKTMHTFFLAGELHVIILRRINEWF